MGETIRIEILTVMIKGSKILLNVDNVNNVNNDKNSTKYYN